MVKRELAEQHPAAAPAKARRTAKWAAICKDKTKIEWAAEMVRRFSVDSPHSAAEAQASAQTATPNATTAPQAAAELPKAAAEVPVKPSNSSKATEGSCRLLVQMGTPPEEHFEVRRVAYDVLVECCAARKDAITSTSGWQSPVRGAAT